jgi:hypothetical protein
LNLQIRVTIIFASLLFLRHDELHTINGKGFKPDLFFMLLLTMTINSLVLADFGKVDKTWVILRLFTRKQVTQTLSKLPLSCLLVFDWLERRKYFANCEINSPSTSRWYLQDGNQSLYAKPTVQSLLPKSTTASSKHEDWMSVMEEDRLWCVAFFGESDQDDLKMSARHGKKSKDALSYSKDAAGSYQLQLHNPTPLDFVWH